MHGVISIFAKKRSSLRPKSFRFAPPTIELTRFVNRHVVLEAVAQAHSRHNAQRDSLLIILVDLDHFKKINHTHGHLASDAVLKEVARRMGN